MLVDVGRPYRLVPEPERDDGDVDAGFQQAHGAAVTQCVRSHFLGRDGRAERPRSGDMPGHQFGDGVTAERLATRPCEQGIAWPATALMDPGTHKGGRLGGE